MAGRRPWLVLVAAVLVIASAIYGFERWGHRPALPSGLIQVNGRLEGDETLVGARVGGRMREVLVREGDTVRQGQLLARIDDVQAQARLAQATQGEAAMRAELRAAESSLRTMELDVPLAVSAAEAGVARVRSTLEKAMASEEQAARDARRFSELASRGSLGVQRSEAARLEWASATADVSLARASLDQAERQLAQARLGPQRIGTERHRVAAMNAQLEQARAVVADAKSVMDDLEIVAPTAGVVLTRMIERGEVVSSGTPLFSLVDLDRLYLKVYVPEPQIGKVRLGLPARIYTDAFPDRPFTATVQQIASRAEFTPKEVQSPDERVKLVYAVKLYLDANPDRCLTPGLPADAIIQHDKEAPWVAPRR